MSPAAGAAGKDQGVNSQFAVHYNRALDFERAGHYHQAIDAYRQAIEANPFDLDALIRLGLMLREVGLDEEANRAFSSALDLSRRDVTGRPVPALPLLR
jgi:tetratricopeptide (TPR) repeat protein